MFPFDRIIQWLSNDKNRWTIEKLHNGTRIIQRPAPDVPVNRILPITHVKPLALRRGEKITGDAVLDGEIIIHEYQAQLERAAREPIPFEIRRQARETGRMVASEQQQQHSILVIDGLALMPNPNNPDASRWWRSGNESAIHDAYEALPVADKKYLRHLCTDTPERVCLHIAIAYPQHAPFWHGATVTQVLPFLAGVAVNTLRPLCRLPIECVNSAGPDTTPFVPAVGAARWRLEVYEADAPDELGKGAA